MLKRFTSFSLDVCAKDKVSAGGGGEGGGGGGGGGEGGDGEDVAHSKTRSRYPFRHWGVELTKDLGVDLFLDVGASFLQEGWADFEEEEEEVFGKAREEEEYPEEDSFPRVLPKDVPHLPLEDGKVIVTHYVSPTNFFVVNQRAGQAELLRMKVLIRFYTFAMTYDSWEFFVVRHSE